MSHSFRIADAQLSVLTNCYRTIVRTYEKGSKNRRSFTRANRLKYFSSLRGDDNRSCLEKKNVSFDSRNRFSRAEIQTRLNEAKIVPRERERRKRGKIREMSKNWRRKRSCLEGSNRVEKCELIRAPPTNVTHARTRGHSRCFTCSHSAELQLVLRALVTHTQANTEAARWRLSATQMCMRA